VWYRGRTAPQTLPAAERRLLAADQEPSLSVISLWEIAKKVQIGKLHLSRDLEVWLGEAAGPPFNILNIDCDVIVEAMRLPDFPNRDSSDELIVATARVYDLTLMTTDRALKNYRHARIHYFKPLIG
jgi:PIN domain nuclease of toxin-antitoxin system